MPSATYELLDMEGRVRGSEDLRCAPGPIGWRSFSTVTFDGAGSRVDLSVDARWHPVRIRIENDAHQLIVSQRGGKASVLLDEEPSEMQGAPIASFPSPAFLVAATRAMPAGGAAKAIAIDPVTLQASWDDQVYELLARSQRIETPVGVFEAALWRTVGREFWIAGDVVVSGPGLRLITYDRGAAGPVPVDQ